MRVCNQIGMVEHLRVELGEDIFPTGFVLVDTHGLEGGMQNNCLGSMCMQLQMGQLTGWFMNKWL